MSSLGLVIVGLLIAAVAAINPHQEWQNFKQLHGKQYGTKTEEAIRFRYFLINKAKIDEHNRLARHGVYSFNLGLNKFADQLHDEFLTTMNLHQRLFKKSNDEHRIFTSSKHGGVADDPAVDWRDHKCVRPVIDLGAINASWPFIATGALEGQYCAAHRVFLPISEQNLLDCVQSASFPTTEDAYQYCVDNGGVDTEDSYPYTGEPGTCKYNPDNKGVLCNGVVNIPSGNETALEEAVFGNGPVSVYIDASQPSFELYINGVYQDDQCSSENLDLQLLIVGFNKTEDGQEYWIAKNWWGTTWGIDGYIWIAKNSNNMCGIATIASYPSTNYCSKTDANCNKKFLSIHS